MGRFITSIVCATILSAAAQTAQADPPTNLPPTLGLYMTDENSLTPKNTFGFNETPFAFLQFDVNDLETGKPFKLNWEWEFNDKTVAKISETVENFPSDSLNLWNSLTNWNLEKQVGEWTVFATWKNANAGHGSDVTSFTVTPEPLSAGLFLMGLPFLAAGLRRRKALRSA